MTPQPGRGHGRDQWNGEGGPRRCICPNCRYERARPPEVPCYALKCPRCGAPMADL
ncbi:MAG: hypothetical protein GKC07_00410 [Methanomicrobiales archaeon]|nr:hypothetical protein [Methanomicrobiales archaeon]